MGRFLAALWNGITAAKNATGNLLFLLIIGLIVGSMLASDTISVDDNTALVINPSGVIVEQLQVADPFSEFLGGYDDGVSETLLRDVLKAIELAEDDDRINLIVLDLSRLRGASMSAMEDIGDALLSFRATGKAVYAWGEGYNQAQYFLAAHADTIVLDRNAFNPLGGVFLTGLGIYPTYFKTALDTLKVDYHVFKAGVYKGFVEPYTRDDMSDESRVANQALIDVLWGHIGDTIARERGLDTGALSRYADEYDELLSAAGGDANQVALDAQLVDVLESRQEFRQRIRARTAKQDETFRQIGLGPYLAATVPPIPVTTPGVDKIAVITASGNIYDGDQPPGAIGSYSVGSIIRQAREDDSVKAVVIRINSPGGSASAAELIRHELELTQEAGKPVVASMGGAAASGGYWIASTSNRIFARATTMTGSIGAFMMFPTFQASLSEIGINTDGVGTTALSNALDPFQPLNPVLKSTLDQSIVVAYNKFIETVARGREMTVEEVDEVAQGRVWAGLTALDHGLVDAIGDLDDAVESAALLASLADYEVVHMEKELSAREQFIRQILNSSLQTLHGAGVSSDLMQALHANPLVDRIREASVVIGQIGTEPGLYSQCLYCRVSF